MSSGFHQRRSIGGVVLWMGTPFPLGLAQYREVMPINVCGGTMTLCDWVAGQERGDHNRL